MNKKLLPLSALFFLSLGMIAFIWWIGWGQYKKSTDDSYVGGNQVRLTSQISGSVISIYADDTELVEEGQVLVVLDKTDRLIAFEKSKAILAERVREVRKLFENVYVLFSDYQKAEARLMETEVRYLNRKQVVESGAVSEEEYIFSETDYLSAKADLTRAKYNLKKGISEVQNTSIENHPLVEKAKSDVREAFINLQRCTLRSPVTGIIAQRRVQVGQTIRPDVPLMAVIPLNQMWVDANFKEVDLSKIRIGQPVYTTSDMYGREVVYRGQVIGIGVGTGAVFSPLPPQNATGNWIKIVQRVPVRVSLDPEELKKNPLRLGLSMNVAVDVHDVTGRKIPEKNTDKFIYQTDVFQIQIEGSEEVIEDILQNNGAYEDDWKTQLN